LGQPFFPPLPEHRGFQKGFLVTLKGMGFGWAAVNGTAVFQSGARSVAAMIEALGKIHDRLRREVGR